MPLEDWFDSYQYEVDYDIGESGAKYLDLAAIGKDFGHVQLRYGHHRGSPELRSLICEQYEDFGPDQICVTTGSSEANFSVIASLVSNSDHMRGPWRRPCTTGVFSRRVCVLSTLDRRSSRSTDGSPAGQR